MDHDADPTPTRLTPDDPLAGLAAWIADGRVDAAAAERARQRRLERQADEDATLAGVLVDLAERGRPVAVRTVGGRVTRGRVAALGAGFVVVREARVGDVFVPFGSLASVRTAPGDAPAIGDRPAALNVGLADALTELAFDRPRVSVAAGGEEVRGELRRAGRDVLGVVVDGERRETINLALAAVDHLILIG